MNWKIRNVLSRLMLLRAFCRCCLVSFYVVYLHIRPSKHIIRLLLRFTQCHGSLQVQCSCCYHSSTPLLNTVGWLIYGCPFFRCLFSFDVLTFYPMCTSSKYVGHAMRTSDALLLHITMPLSKRSIDIGARLTLLPNILPQSDAPLKIAELARSLCHS